MHKQPMLGPKPPADFNPPRQFWYIACASSQLADKPRAVRVLDHDIAVYRDGEGRPAALEDRCCHRGVRLSLGRVTKGHLACGYHGWQYERGGQCVFIPSLCEDQEMPGGVRVRSFPCVEQDGYVWVWTGEGPPSPSEPARISGFEGAAWRQGTCDNDCSATMLLENQFDCAHPAFAHEGTHPSYFFSRLKGLREYEFEVRTTADGMVAFFPPTQSADDPLPEESNSRTSFEAPNRIYIRQKMFTVDFCLVLHIIPTSPNTCRLEYLQRDRKGEGVQWVETETKLIEQDRVLLESAQPAYDELGASFERSVPADFVTLLLRRIMRLLQQSDWQSEIAKLQRRRLVKVRS